MRDRSWEVNVYCQVYRIEFDRAGRPSEEDKRVSKDLLENLLMKFHSRIHAHIRDVLLEICENRDEMFRFPRGCEASVSDDAVRAEVQRKLETAIGFGELKLRKLDDRWWERMPPPELTKPPRRKPIRAVPPRLEPVELPKKTWFAAQFVDESGLWIDGLSVKFETSGAIQSLTTDKAGVVELKNQTASISVVLVADLAQAEAILVSRLDKLDEASSPTGRDIVSYPLEEPPKTVVLSAASPRTIVLGLQRTWFEARVVDEVGVPVPGLDLAFSANGDSTLTTDGAGVARLETFGNPSATVMIASTAQAQSILDPRWAQVREAEIPGGSEVSVLQLAEVMGAIPLVMERRHTIVLTPERTWIEVRVVDDNNKPISNMRARLHLTDGRVVDKVLEDDGLVRGDEIPSGVCKFVLPVKDRKEWIDPDAPAPAEDPKELPKGHWIVRKRIEPPGPEVEELETGESHVVVVGRKIVEQLEIDDALFRLMSAVLLPEAQNPGTAPTEPDGTRPTTLDLLAASLRYAQLHPKDRRILITGHTDTSGDDEYNQNLSEFRAIAVHAVLTNGDGARQDFGDVCHGPHLQGKEKKQQVLYDDRVQVLNWVAATFGWPCSTSGEYWNYLQAVKDFQRTYNTEGNDGNPRELLEIDGDFGPASWRAVFDCYQIHLAETLEITAEKLERLQGDVRGQFVKKSRPLVGCGEYKPKEMAGLDNYRSQTNRRVEVLFFEPKDHLPETPCLVGDCDPGGCELYDRPWYLRKRLAADLSLAMASLTVLVYQAGTTTPIEGAHVVLGGPCPGDGHTDALGLVTFEQLEAGEYVLAVSQAGYSQASMTVNVPYGQPSTAQGDMQSFAPLENAKEVEQGKGPSPNPPVAVPLARTITSLRIESVTFLSDHNLLNDYDKDYADNLGAHIRPEWTVAKARKNEQSSVSHTMDTEVTLEVELLVEPANASPHPLKLTGTASHGLIFESKPESKNVRGGTNRIQLKSDKRLPKEIVDFNFEVEWSASYAQQAAASPPPPKPNPAKTTNWMFLTFGIPVVPSGRTGPTSDPDSPPRQGITRKRMIEATRAASATELHRVLHNPSASPLDPHVVAEGLVMRFTVDPENNLKNEWELADASAGACYTIVRYTDAVMCMLGCPGQHRNLVVWAWVKSPDKPESNDAPYPNMHFVAHGQPRTQDYRNYGSPPDASKNHWIAWLDAGGRNKFEAILSLTHGATGTRLYAPGFGPKRTYREVLFSFDALCWYDGKVKQGVIYNYSAHQPP